MKQKGYLIIVLVLCLSVHTQAQNFSIHPLPTQRLLPVASIHCVMQDSEGYMWYGTEGGLCRDNGYQIDVFRPSATDRPQEACLVSCMAEDGTGNILFGTGNGLYRIDRHDYQVTKLTPDSLSLHIEALFIDSRRRLWVGVHGKIYECDSVGNVIAVHPCLTEARPASVASIVEDSQGNLYVTQWRSGILRMRKGEKLFSALRWPLRETPGALVEDASHRYFWVVTSGAGIQKMNIDGDVCVLTPQPATMGSSERSHALHLLHDPRHGLFWVVTQDNLYAYSLGSDGQLQPVSTSPWLPEGKKILDQLCMDRDGNIYVGGFTPHSFIITSEQKDIKRVVAPSVTRTTGFPLLADRTVHMDSRYLWIWQGRKGLLLYNRENDTEESLPWKVSRNIEPCSQGGIWAFSDSCVFRLWLQQGHIAHEQVAAVPGGAYVSRLHESPDGLLWVATGRRLYSMPLSGRQLQPVTDLPAEPLDMSADRQGRLFLALGTEGLSVVQAGRELQRIDCSQETFLSVTTAGDGTVWVSSHEGHVYHYRPDIGTMEQEPLLSSRNGAAIRFVRTDALGHVWTMTDQQVCEYEPVSQAFRILHSTDPQVDVSYFYALEPMDQNHVCIDGAGALIEVQSSAGLHAQRSNAITPHVSSVEVNGQVRLIGRGQQTLQLASDEQDVTLRLTTFDPLHTHAISFAYQLEGITHDWVYLPQGINTVFLGNLPKGEHRLLVKATDRYGCWSDARQLLVIDRAPYWWETWWAYILYICIALAVLYGIWRLERRIHLLRRLILRRQEVRLDEIEMKRDDIAGQQRDDEFLRRAIAKTEEHLSEPDYNVEALSSDLCMSRITLYRRIQEQTGQTPTDFIRDIRLKKAASLLAQHRNATVADVARKVGFATPKYFSRCFKEKFGVLPRDYHAS